MRSTVLDGVIIFQLKCSLRHSNFRSTIVSRYVPSFLNTLLLIYIPVQLHTGNILGILTHCSRDIRGIHIDEIVECIIRTPILNYNWMRYRILHWRFNNNDHLWSSDHYSHRPRISFLIFHVFYSMINIDNGDLFTLPWWTWMTQRQFYDSAEKTFSAVRSDDEKVFSAETKNWCSIVLADHSSYTSPLPKRCTSNTSYILHNWAPAYLETY